jgi:integrase
MSPSRKLPPHVFSVTNRLGKSYTYLQRNRGTATAGERIRLPDPDDPQFWSEYARLMQLAPQQKKTDTMQALIETWQASPEWSALGSKTRTEWARYCKRVNAAWGSLQVKGIEPKHVIALRDTYAGTPAAANNLMRCLSSMLGWSVPRGWRSDNPCREVKLLRGGEAYQPWPWSAIENARSDLRPDLRLAMELALYTGQRQGDVLAMRWDAISAGGVAVKQEKTGKRLFIPLHRDLRAVLDGIPKVAVTILTNSSGRPWTKAGFRATWQDNRPDCIRGLVFHGLRKSAVVFLLEAGATTAEVAAITGQTMQMVAHYAQAVNQQRLAASAVARWEGSR